MKNNNKKICKDWFIELQNLICKAVLELEKEYGSTAKFKRNKWSKGEYRIIEGDVIEKGGVAFSNVVGKFPKDFAKQIMECSPVSIRTSLDVVRRGLEFSDVKDAMTAQYDSVKALWNSEDLIEGPLAFSEKRKPNWN